MHIKLLLLTPTNLPLEYLNPDSLSSPCSGGWLSAGLGQLMTIFQDKQDLTSISLSLIIYILWRW